MFATNQIFLFVTKQLCAVTRVKRNGGRSKFKGVEIFTVMMWDGTNILSGVCGVIFNLPYTFLSDTRLSLFKYATCTRLYELYKI